MRFVIPAKITLVVRHLIRAKALFPLENPTIVSVPLGFLAAIVAALFTPDNGRSELPRTDRPRPHRVRVGGLTFSPSWRAGIVLESANSLSGGSIAALLVAALLAGCSSSTPRLHRPDRIEAYCGDRAAIPTAIESIVSSTSDKADNAPVPSVKAIRDEVRAAGGIIAHWSDQPLYLPTVAKTLGTGNEYVTLGDAAIGNRTMGDSRRIYLTVKSANGAKIFAVRAYDVQDVCNEGKLSS